MHELPQDLIAYLFAAGATGRFLAKLDEDGRVAKWGRLTSDEADEKRAEYFYFAIGPASEVVSRELWDFAQENAEQVFPE